MTNIPEFTFLDTNHIKVNKDFKVKVYEYGKNKHPILSLDNFLENPEDVIDIISKHPFPNSQSLKAYHPGWRVHCLLDFEEIRSSIVEICNHYYDVENYFQKKKNRTPEIDIQFNLYKGGNPCLLTSVLPHVDDAFIACNLHLNPDNENMGGTDFFSHVPTGLDGDYTFLFGEKFTNSREYLLLKETKRISWMNNYQTIHDDYEVDSRQDYWERKFTVEAKFNRLNIYPAYLFHCVGMKKDWYLNKRYSLVAAIR